MTKYRKSATLILRCTLASPAPTPVSILINQEVGFISLQVRKYVLNEQCLLEHIVEDFVNNCEKCWGKTHKIIWWLVVESRQTWLEISHVVESRFNFASWTIYTSHSSTNFLPPQILRTWITLFQFNIIWSSFGHEKRLNINIETQLYKYQQHCKEYCHSWLWR